MRRALFVDDEPLVLDGLADLLRPLHRQWDMHFAPDGPVALELLSQQPFDVLVSDMRMPGMDGATLLREVKSRFPSVIRMILSGQMDEEARLRSLPFAQEFLAKPCRPDVWAQVLDRACLLHTHLDKAMASRQGNTNWDIAEPTLFLELSDCLCNSRATVATIAALVSKHPEVSAWLGEFVRAFSSGAADQATSIEEYARVVGIEQLRNLLLVAELFAIVSKVSRGRSASTARVAEHSFRVAQLSSRLGRPSQRSLAFAAGMMHDFGWILEPQFGPLDDAGFGHAELGACLLLHWGLPNSLVEAVAFHHHPWDVPHRDFEVLDAVFVADLLDLMPETEHHLTRYALDTSTASPDGATCAPEVQAYLEWLKIADRGVPQWRKYLEHRG